MRSVSKRVELYSTAVAHSLANRFYSQQAEKRQGHRHSSQRHYDSGSGGRSSRGGDSSRGWQQQRRSSELQSATFSGYRRLLRAAHIASENCPLHNRDGLQSYLSQRFYDIAERNRLQRIKRSLVQRQLQMVAFYAEALSQAPGDEALTSMLQVLAAGVGSTAYQRAVEKGFIDYLQHQMERANRREADEEATSERQNRILQYALQPYAERLLYLHRVAESDGPGSQEVMPGQRFTSQQAIAAVVGNRHNISAHYFNHGKEHILIEVDDALNKQVVYVCCEEFDWAQEVERVEIAENEYVRQTVFHAEYMSTAERLLEAILTETPLHAYRSTVVVGHGVGGAVGVCIALLLHTRGFEVKNMVTFGAPKTIQSTMDRYISAINPVRVVLTGDPLIDLPVTGSEGDVFIHIGEILLMDWSASAKADRAKEAHETEQPETSSEPDAEDSDESGVLGRRESRARREQSAARGVHPETDSVGSAATISAEAIGDFMMLDNLDEDSETTPLQQEAEDKERPSHAPQSRKSASVEELPSRARVDGFYYADDVAEERIEAADNAYLYGNGRQNGVEEDGDYFGEGNDSHIPASMMSSAEREGRYGEASATRGTSRVHHTASRYRAAYTMRHYSACIHDGESPLTYAEGDDVWDDGDYAGSKTRNQNRAPSTETESRDRDMRGPL